MDCYSVLGVEPGADLKTVKRAYSKLLKKTKPDQNPEGFKQLRAAFEEAKAWAPHQSELGLTKLPSDNLQEVSPYPSADPSTRQLENVTQLFSTNERLQTNDILLDDLDVGEFNTSQEHLDYDALWDLADEAINNARKKLAKSEGLDDIEYWRSLASTELMDDLQIKSFISGRIFAVIAKRVLSYPNYYRREALNQADTLFMWSSQTELLEQYVEPAAIIAYEKSLSSLRDRFKARWIPPVQTPGRPQYIKRLERLASLFIDTLIFTALSFLALFLVQSITGEPIPNIEVLEFALLIAPMYYIAFDCSPIQGTPGKVLANQRVVTGKGRRIGLVRSIWRFGLSYVAVLSAAYTYWLNIFLPDARTWHDRFSGTAVVRRDQ